MIGIVAIVFERSGKVGFLLPNMSLGERQVRRRFEPKKQL
jgi:hypothetical protein